MHRTANKIILKGIIVASAFSCAKEKSSKSNPPQKSPENHSGNQTPLALADDFKGIWTSPCRKLNTGLFADAFQKSELHLDGQEFSIAVGAFGDENCNSKTLNRVIYAGGKLSLNATGRNDGSFAANFSIEDAQLIPLTSEATTTLAANGGTCGLAEWAVGTIADIQEQNSCALFTTLGILPFDLVKKDGEKLLLGDGTDGAANGRSSENRPAKLAAGTTWQATKTSEFEEINIESDEGDEVGVELPEDQTANPEVTPELPAPIPTIPAPEAIPEPIPSPTTPPATDEDRPSSPQALTFAELDGHWGGTIGKISSDDGRIVSASFVSLSFIKIGNKFTLDYGICQHDTYCSSGDTFGSASGEVIDNALYGRCTWNGSSVSFKLGELNGTTLRILALDPFSAECPQGSDFVEISRKAEGRYEVVAMSKEYDGTVYTGTGAVAKLSD
jgi:hypothetical protein